MTYVDVDGLKTWYDEAGTGDPLVLLHGGLSTNASWASQMGPFAERFHVYAPERRAHGHTPDVEGPLTYKGMAADTIAFLEQIVGSPAHLVGWSDGGNVALMVAMERPDLVRKIVVFGSNFDTAGLDPIFEEMAEGAAEDPDADMMRMLYASVSPDGPDHWPVVCGKIAEMWKAMHVSPTELARIAAPTLVMSGDDDAVTLEHTIEMYRSISGAELAVVPGTSHTLALEKPELVNKLVLDFLTNDPPATFLPIRRR